MRPFGYASPATLDEATGLLRGDGDGAIRPLAGGTDLLTLMKADIAAPASLVDIKRISELSDRIEEAADGITLGALTTLTQVETSALIQDRYPALAQAAGLAATPQLRNMATIGGNLLQRPRCWYFRSSAFHCWLKGGTECDARDGQNQLHALFGGGPCYAVHPSDPASALLALEAEVHLRGPGGERTVPLAGFFALPTDERRVETTLEPDELLISVRIPRLPAGTRGTYLKAMDRKVWAFALVAVAAVLRTDGSKIEDARLVLGGVAPIPWRATAAERMLIGADISDELLSRAADAALADAQPLAHNGYKLLLAHSLIRRALRSLAESQG